MFLFNAPNTPVTSIIDGLADKSNLLCLLVPFTIDIIINLVLGSYPQALTIGNITIIITAAIPPNVVIPYPIINGTGVTPLLIAVIKAAIPLKSHNTKMNNGMLVLIPKQKYTNFSGQTMYSNKFQPED